MTVLQALCCLAGASAIALATSVSTYPAVHESNKVPPITPQSTQNQKNYSAPVFPLLGFEQYAGNPILGANPARDWESKYVYNPAAVVIDDKVWLVYRAQNTSLISTLGLAWSDDGYNFTRYTEPVLCPTEPYETHGTEDPRLIRVNGTFHLTYTGFNGSLAQLCMATSTDLVHWKKHGPILPDCTDVDYLFDIPQNAYTAREHWSKSGAIIDEPVNGLYQMQWGDSFLMSANSTDLLNWNYTVNDVPFAQKLNVWEQGLMESGAPPIKTRGSDRFWIKFYNGVALGAGGYKTGSYNTGQMLIDMVDAPRGPPVARVETPLVQPVTRDEQMGQTMNVVFTEGIVQFNGKWMLYYGEADTFVGVATTDVQP